MVACDLRLLSGFLRVPKSSAFDQLLSHWKFFGSCIHRSLMDDPLFLQNVLGTRPSHPEVLLSLPGSHSLQQLR